MENAFDDFFDTFSQERSDKPRQTGLTIVRDRGLGLNQAEDLVRVCGDFVDTIRIDQGTEALYDKIFIKEKIDLYKEHKIDTMPGESVLEIAIWNKIYEQYLKNARDLGFTVMGISSGTIAMRQKIRMDVIKKSLQIGFKLISIAGRKHPEEKLSFQTVLQLISDDLKMGAYKVLIKAEQYRNGFGICDSEGRIIKKQILEFLEGVRDPDALVWEAPLRNQQQDLIYHLGLNVNLDGIEWDTVLSLEALRQGFIGEKDRRAYLERKYWEDLQNV
jgi:phosphosulfolactate synthase